LFEPLVLPLPVADLSPDGLFVPADRVHQEPTGPKVLAHEVALALPIDPRQVDRALAPDEPDVLRHREFRRNRQGGVGDSVSQVKPGGTRRSSASQVPRDGSIGLAEARDEDPGSTQNRQPWTIIAIASRPLDVSTTRIDTV
jgi:hypothetical protein